MSYWHLYVTLVAIRKGFFISCTGPCSLCESANGYSECINVINTQYTNRTNDQTITVIAYLLTVIKTSNTEATEK